jgi:hypothetical protein
MIVLGSIYPALTIWLLTSAPVEPADAKKVAPEVGPDETF